MFLMLASGLLASWAMYMAWKFYRRMDWDEPAEPSPDFHGMHKKQAQLQHIQEVLEEAHHEGKLSKQVVDEFNRYCETEDAAMQSAETAWKSRKR
jgi:hypothetical protein